MSNESIKILGIETSCDETAAAVVSFDKSSGKLDILSNIVASQIELHQKFGGVYPEVASRAHTEKIVPVIDEALTMAGSDRGIKDIDAIAVTFGPGLIGSLVIGVAAAKTLAFSANKPIIPINHWEGHIYSNFFGIEKSLEFPALVLTVSGGHSSLILMKDHGNYELLGQTLDDAAGEAFDKVAKLMGLSYPGGPIISMYAEKLKHQNEKIKNTVQNEKYRLPVPMMDNKSFNFSFSGLKTAVYYKVKDLQLTETDKVIFSYNFQEAVIESLIGKTLLAAEKYKPNSICLAGGVSANKALRKRFEEEISQLKWKPGIFIPEFSLSTDNAAMIAGAGVYNYLRGNIKKWDEIEVNSGARLC